MVTSKTSNELPLQEQLKIQLANMEEFKTKYIAAKGAAEILQYLIKEQGENDASTGDRSTNKKRTTTARK